MHIRASGILFLCLFIKKQKELLQKMLNCKSLCISVQKLYFFKNFCYTLIVRRVIR